MTTKPVGTQEDRTPTWLVQEVFDPDHTGQDFAYTIGLHDRGLPEVHLWASPTDGDDPGEDWSLSGRDRLTLLNQLAFTMLDGAVGEGSTWTRTFDAGDAVVTFTLGQPVDPHDVEAYGVAPSSVVLPLRWGLQRPPAGQLGPLEPADRLTAWERYAELRRAMSRDRKPPEGWALPRFPEFEPHQRFGPQTPLVLARAAQLWGADDLGPLLHTLLPHATGVGLTWPTALARVAVRVSGRSDAVRELQRQMPALVDHVVDADPARWIGALTTLEPDYASRESGVQRAIAENARDWLWQAAFTVLLAEIAYDAADEATRLAALGAWTAGFNGGRVVPGEPWVAGPRVLRAVRKLLRPLDLETWRQIAAAHNSHRLMEESDYNDLCWRLTTRLQTSASGLTWRKLQDLPAARELTEDPSRSLRRRIRWSDMEEWSSCVGALLTHPAEFSARDVETFVRPTAHVLPGLASLLNRNIAAHANDRTC